MLLCIVVPCNVTEGAEFAEGFLTECGGIDRGGSPRVPQALRGGLEVDPDKRGQTNPISTSTEEGIGITLCVWMIIPRVWGGFILTRHP